MPRATLDPLDPVGIDALLDETERDLREGARQVATSLVLPHVAAWFEAGAVPDVRGLFVELGRAGLLGMHLTGYGCAGVSATAYGLACTELEAVDSGLRSMVSVQGSLAMAAIHRFGSDEQRERWLPGMAAGTTVGCFGLTEPDAGSDPASMTTRAVRDRDDWRLTGRKMWITNAPVADVAVVWARTGDDPRSIRGFLVPTNSPGVQTPEIHHKLSLRASVTGELVLDDVRLPADAELPGAQGLSGPLWCLNEARFGIVHGVMGAARTAYGCALDYAGTRTQFGRPIAGFQLTQAKLAEMATALSTGSLLALHLGRRKDAGTLLPAQVSLGKLHNVRAALEICRTARTVLGGNGISLEYPVIRHVVNLETVLTYEGTHEMHTLVVGQALTGLDAFR